ncbi:hypothetical protein [Blastopirellula marina]|uniref:Uncharacterized protein n=1 Tax=Blastopirellula marina TaxID=124 RepID=A0A2S8FN44_9BACT|nr:hypothetical protein [Blastopirellula marina]PQO33611.1 hypothetical protein C5Y98_15325 [Blastopirellula marina]PTL43398.1 hypothetical protein C5Y97_15335 [Blastopirellula marina]
MSFRRLRLVGIVSGICAWKSILVLLYTAWLIGGLSQTHHLPTGKPSHPHSDDSLCAETSEFENDEVEAEIVYLATAPDLVTPYMQVTSERVVCPPIFHSAYQPSNSLLLRGPPVA